MGAQPKDESSKYLPTYTIGDWALWEGQWELIKGVPWAMTPAPRRSHQRISFSLARLLDDGLQGCGRCEVCLTINYRIDPNTVLQPDLCIVCDNGEDFTYLEEAPNLVVEILSPSTATKDLNIKADLYAEQGIPYYLIVHPDEEWVRVLTLEGNDWVVAMQTRDESFSFQFDECSVEIDFSRIWED